MCTLARLFKGVWFALLAYGSEFRQKKIILNIMMIPEIFEFVMNYSKTPENKFLNSDRIRTEL